MRPAERYCTHIHYNIIILYYEHDRDVYDNTRT